ncbi:hypothetical protein HUU51_01985 [Candidatus Gracilibacteria bacterium]|nr:hypothetical protein [Candidatus Gracilibacteria bacterium]
MSYNRGLELGNNLRNSEKETRINNIETMILNTWNSGGYIENEEEYSQTKFEKIAKILKDNGKISGKKDLRNKLLELSEKGYSYDEIGKAISNVVAKLEIGTEIDIHKQTISRVIEAARINKTNFRNFSGK